MHLTEHKTITIKATQWADKLNKYLNNRKSMPQPAC